MNRFHSSAVLCVLGAVFWSNTSSAQLADRLLFDPRRIDEVVIAPHANYEKTSSAVASSNELPAFSGPSTPGHLRAVETPNDRASSDRVSPPSASMREPLAERPETVRKSRARKARRATAIHRTTHTRPSIVRRHSAVRFARVLRPQFLKRARTARVSRRSHGVSGRSWRRLPRYGFYMGRVTRSVKWTLQRAAG
jgi:hypothetical protein